MSSPKNHVTLHYSVKFTSKKYPDVWKFKHCDYLCAVFYTVSALTLTDRENSFQIIAYIVTNVNTFVNNY
jgi:hypothetical protein